MKSDKVRRITRGTKRPKDKQKLLVWTGTRTIRIKDKIPFIKKGAVGQNQFWEAVFPNSVEIIYDPTKPPLVFEQLRIRASDSTVLGRLQGLMPGEFFIAKIQTFRFNPDSSVASMHLTMVKDPKIKPDMEMIIHPTHSIKISRIEPLT